MSGVDADKRPRGPQPGTGSPRRAVVTVKEVWSPLPEWVLTLAEACDRTSQSAVAKRLNYSGSVISAVLNGVYKGNTDAVEKAVRGALMAETLECPVLGEIRKNICLTTQNKARDFQPTSFVRVQLYRNCRGGCVHSRLAKTLEAPNA